MLIKRYFCLLVALLLCTVQPGFGQDAEKSGEPEIGIQEETLPVAKESKRAEKDSQTSLAPKKEAISATVKDKESEKSVQAESIPVAKKLQVSKEAQQDDSKSGKLIEDEQPRSVSKKDQLVAKNIHAKEVSSVAPEKGKKQEKIQTPKSPEKTKAIAVEDKKVAATKLVEKENITAKKEKGTSASKKIVSSSANEQEKVKQKKQVASVIKNEPLSVPEKRKESVKEVKIKDEPLSTEEASKQAVKDDSDKILKLEVLMTKEMEAPEYQNELLNNVRGKLMTGFKDQGVKGNWSTIKEKIEIISIKVQGYVGPESLKKGKQTILAKNIDPLNIKRAEDRARLVSKLVQQQLDIPPSPNIPVIVLGDELQFTKAEWMDLNRYATGQDEQTENTKIKTGWIYNIIRMYRNGEPLNAESTKGLSEIYGKRDIVHLEINYKIEVPAQAIKTSPVGGSQQIPEKGIQIDEGDTTPVVVRTIVWICIIFLFLIIAGYFLLKWYREYLAKKPAFEEEFSDSDRMVRPSIRMSKNSIIAILSGKGGTGKSSISSSLAYLLAHCGFRTLIVDTDLFTHGVSLLTVPKEQRESVDSISSLLIEKGHKKKVEDLQPALLKTPFTRDNLYILPSFPSEELKLDNLNLKSSAQTVKGFSRKLRECLVAIKHKYRFDFILIDTRGGTDITNIGAAVAAESYILVTEPGKISWDLGEQLLEGINRVKKELLLKTSCMGFIINKNTLGAKELEAYLQKKWDLNHIATVPFDPKAVECFEQGKISVTENMKSDFSKGILEIMEKATYSSGWNNYNNAYLQKIKDRSVFSAFLKALGNKENKSES